MSNKAPVTICVINLKGGVGKSTIAALLSRHAYRSRMADVLTVDLDPQANLSQALMGHEYREFLDERRPSIVELFKGYQPATATKASTAPIEAADLVQTIGSRRSGGSLQLIPSRFDFSDNLTGALELEPQALARFLSDNFQDKDYIFIDCSPTESVFTQAAYHASGFVLVPVKPEFFATIGFPLLHESLSDFRRHNRGNTIDVAGVVINNAFYDGGNDGGPEKKRAMREIRAEARSNDWHVFRRQIPHSRGFPKMMRGDNMHLGNAYQFQHFAEEFFTHLAGLV